EPDINKLASLDNLLHAWKQAKQQVKDREVFDDVLGFELFEKDIYSNLQVLSLQLIQGIWKHNNFLIIKIPKEKGTDNFRPYSSVSPREAVVQLAILNVIGPKIDSRMHNHSLGNRLAVFPRSDSQIFQDWRKQNVIREFKK